MSEDLHKVRTTIQPDVELEVTGAELLDLQRQGLVPTVAADPEPEPERAPDPEPEHVAREAPLATDEQPQPAVARRPRAGRE